jgi:hypothetical protein
LIVLAERDTKYDGGNVLETMDPLLAFAALAADVKHAAASQLGGAAKGPETVGNQDVLLDTQLAHLKSSFIYAGGFGPRPKYVHLIRQVVRPNYSLSLFKEAVDVVVSISALRPKKASVVPEDWEALVGSGDPR